MTKRFIDTVISEMRQAYLASDEQTVEDTKSDIAEVATKQVLRGMRVDGLGSNLAEERARRNTANRILPEAEDRKCPEGYYFNKKELRCDPIKPRDSVGGKSDKDSKPGNTSGYNVWGSSGYAGGYAWEENPTSNDLASAGEGAGGDMGESFFIQDEKGNIYEGKKDACYHKVKSRYKVFPSAYASGSLVQCRKAGAKNWGNSTKKEDYYIDNFGNQYVIQENTLAELVSMRVKVEGGIKKWVTQLNSMRQESFVREDFESLVSQIQKAKTILTAINEEISSIGIAKKRESTIFKKS